MTDRIFNFSAGPAVMPESVLEQARENLLSLGSTGIGILEHSHRSQAFTEVIQQAESRCRQLAGIPDNYRVLFLQGGASLQFAMLPMNLLSSDQTADYWITGSWSKKAIKEAGRFGHAHPCASSEDRNFCYIPHSADYSTAPLYVHFTSNNTIFGTQFRSEPQIPEQSFLVCDASSDIFSRPIDVTRYGVVYAGAQKNLGPSGVTLVVIREDLLEPCRADTPTMLRYDTHAQAGSLYNTPPTFGIYLMSLVFEWLLQQGGLEAIERQNQRKAQLLYDQLDRSQLFQATADADSRSLMNVTFVTGDAELDRSFIEQATAAGLDGLKGHRSVGGMRASLYNAFPEAGVERLVEVLRDFENSHS